MSTPLAGKAALVTGATSDVGMAVSLALAEAGAVVHALGRREMRLAELAALAPEGRVAPHTLDLNDAEALDALLADVGAIDVLVLNAAHAAERAPLLEGGEPALRAVLETNFFAAARAVLGVLPGMAARGWGRIVHVSSLAASIGEAHGPAYCASKAAMDALLRSIAIDYSPRGVTANAVEAGPLATERLDRWGPAKARRMALAAAVRRLGTPADVAAAVLYLASPAAGFVTGETHRVTGGLHLGNPLAAMYVRESTGPEPTGRGDA
jgi:3-oxoacyl-[acyl-carrier protein] reductase